jgi:hypothetical protein
MHDQIVDLFITENEYLYGYSGSYIGSSYNIVIRKEEEIKVLPFYKSIRISSEINLNIYCGYSFMKGYKDCFISDVIKDISWFGLQQSADLKIKILLELLNLFPRYSQSDLLNKFYNLFELELFK